MSKSEIESDYPLEQCETCRHSDVCMFIEVFNQIGQITPLNVSSATCEEYLKDKELEDEPIKSNDSGEGCHCGSCNSCEEHMSKKAEGTATTIEGVLRAIHDAKATMGKEPDAPVATDKNAMLEEGHKLYKALLDTIVDIKNNGCNPSRILANQKTIDVMSAYVSQYNQHSGAKLASVSGILLEASEEIPYSMFALVE